MTDWDTICIEGERLADDLIRKNVDLSEAQKLLDYFRFKNWDERSLKRYLTTMSEDPPIRSKKSKSHFNNIREMWTGWKTELKGIDKARAWGIAIRTAKAKKKGVNW